MRLVKVYTASGGIQIAGLDYSTRGSQSQLVAPENFRVSTFECGSRSLLLGPTPGALVRGPKNGARMDPPGRKHARTLVPASRNRRFGKHGVQAVLDLLDFLMSCAGQRRLDFLAFAQLPGAARPGPGEPGECGEDEDQSREGVKALHARILPPHRRPPALRHLSLETPCGGVEAWRTERPPALCSLIIAAPRAHVLGFPSSSMVGARRLQGDIRAGEGLRAVSSFLLARANREILLESRV